MSTDWGFYCQKCDEKYIVDECRRPEVCGEMLKARAAIVSMLRAVSDPNDVEMTIGYSYRIPCHWFLVHDRHEIIIVNEYYGITHKEERDIWKGVK